MVFNTHDLPVVCSVYAHCAKSYLGREQSHFYGAIKCFFFFSSHYVHMICVQLLLKNSSRRKAVMVLGLGVDGLNPQTEHCGENFLCVNDNILC